MTKNLVGDGCLERTDCGLSNFGMDVIQEMNQLGILIDLSHVKRKTTLEAIEVSKKPVAFTHANARGIWDHPRNKTDEEFKLLAEKGGVTGVNAYPTFVSPGKPTIKEMLDHVDYLVNLIGIDHVGIGTDYIEGQPREYFMTRRGEIGLGCKFPEGVAPATWPWVFPEGITSVADFPNLVTGLAEKGYGPEEIRKIMGGNFMKLFAEVW
jgi:membrane dipeptidase